MSTNKVSDTRAQLPTAPYDNLGWVKAAFERSLNLVRSRLKPNYAYASAKMALNYAKTWHPDSTPGADKYFEYGMLGIAANLWHEHPRRVLEELVAVGSWDDMSVVIPVQPVDSVKQLLNSSMPESEWIGTTSNNKTGVRLDIVIAANAVQALIPDVQSLSPLYFDLSISSIKGWLIRDTAASTHRGTCAVTGKNDDVRAYVKNGITKDISRDGLRKMQGWKPATTLTVHGVKQIGLPVLGNCPTCITRRQVRSEDEEVNTPAYPLPTSWLDANSEAMSIGNPINTGQRVLTGAFLKVWPGKGNVLQKQIRRQCPACMALAIKNPGTYCAFITEVNSHKGSGPVTPALVREWTEEHAKKDGNTMRYMFDNELEIAMQMQESKDAQAPETFSVDNRHAEIMDACVLFEADTPGLLNDFVTFKIKSKGKVRARLKKGVSIEQLTDVLDMYGAFDLSPVTDNPSKEEEE